jgi:hypothetical protein
MTTELDEKTQIPLKQILKFKSLKSKRIRSGSHTDLSDLGLAWPSKQQTKRGQLYTLVVRREKIEKKYKQSITDNNTIMIYLHTLHHVKEGITVHLVRRRMTKFDSWKTFHVSLMAWGLPTRWGVCNRR